MAFFFKADASVAIDIGLVSIPVMFEFLSSTEQEAGLTCFQTGFGVSVTSRPFDLFVKRPTSFNHLLVAFRISISDCQSSCLTYISRIDKL